MSEEKIVDLPSRYCCGSSAIRSDNHTEICVVMVDMIGSTRLWAEAFQSKENSKKKLELEKVWAWVTELQRDIMCEMLNSNWKGRFVKGVGDELIFCYAQVSQAVDAATAAREYLENKPIDEPFLHIYSGQSKTWGDVLRFVIHWTTGGVLRGDYDLRKNSYALRPVFECPNDILCTHQNSIDFPRHPDLFGHQINYAARCISLVNEHGLYITQDAIDQSIKEDGNKPSCEWPLVMGGAKGIDSSIIISRLIDLSSGYELTPATTNSYKAKAVVYVRTNNAKEIFVAAKEIMRQGSEKLQQSYANEAPGDRERLKRHLFLMALLEKDSWQAELGNKDSILPKKGETPTVFLRVEAIDSEFLDDLLTKNTTVQEVFAAQGEDAGENGGQFNTETRFLRTSSKLKVKWADRSLNDFGSSICLYLEFQPATIEGIDNLAARLSDLDNKKLVSVVEFGQMWGEPSVYALVTYNAPYDDVKKVVKNILQYIVGNNDLKMAQGSRVTATKVSNLVSLASDWNGS